MLWGRIRRDVLGLEFGRPAASSDEPEPAEDLQTRALWLLYVLIFGIRVQGSLSISYPIRVTSRLTTL